MIQGGAGSIDVHLENVRLDPNVRLSGAEQADAQDAYAPYLNSQQVCLLDAWLGGAQEGMNTWWFGSISNNAQTSCNTSWTVFECLDKIKAKNPKLANWLQEKGNAAQKETAKHYDTQRAQDTVKVLKTEASVLLVFVFSVVLVAGGLLAYKALED